MPDIFDEIGETQTKPTGDVFDEIFPEIPKPKPWELSLTGQKPYLGQFSGGLGSPYEELNREEALNIFKSLVEPPIAAPTFKGETTLGKVAAGVGNVAGGIYNMVASPVGALTIPLAATKLGAPIAKGVFGGLAAKTAGEQLGEASVTGDVQQYTEGLLNALMAPGIALPGKFGYVEPEKVRMAKDLAREIGRAEPTIEPTTPEAIRQLGVRVPDVTPFADPEVARLADAALQERMRLVQVPGQEQNALMDLRRALEPPRIEIAQPVARAERIQGGGEAPYGKVSFMREAEAPLPERTQSALAEPAPKPMSPAPVEAAAPVAETAKSAEVETKANPVDVSQVESVPATENGGRIAIILPDGTAIVGGRIHADTWNRAVDQGVATDAALADGYAGFVKPDGTAWGVNGKPLPKVSKVVIVGSEQPKPPALPSQIPALPPPEAQAKPAAAPSEAKTEVSHGKRTTIPAKVAGMIGEPISQFSKKLGLPEDFYEFVQTGEGFEPGQKTGYHQVSDKYRTPELDAAIDRLDKAHKARIPTKPMQDRVESEMARIVESVKQPPSQPSAGIEVKKQGAEGIPVTVQSLTADIRSKMFKRDTIREEQKSIRPVGNRTKLNQAQKRKWNELQSQIEDANASISLLESQRDSLRKEQPLTPGPGAQTVGETQPPQTKGIITGRAIEKWADDQLRGGGTHLGPDVLAAYIVKGVALIERGIINFAEWSARMIAEHGDKVKPHLRELFEAAQETAKRATPSQTGDLKSAREIVEQRIRAMTEGEEVKMRKSAARATESPAIPEPVQEKIETAPESFYRVQPNELVEEAVKRMSDAELVSVPAESNLFVAARLEAANRLFTAGEMDKGYQIFVELEKQGTSFGQNINQFKRLPGTLPEHTAFLINQKLKNAGKDPLTKQQEAKAIDLTKASKQADAELDRATEAWRKDPTDANATKAQDALLKSNNAAIALQRFIGAFDPRGTASVLKSILQGNLLTPISEVANLFGNMSFLPFRAMDRSIASGLDIIDNAVRGKGREVSVSPIGGTAAAIGGARHGLSRVPEIMFRGTGDTIKGEMHTGLHPVRAWINQFAKNPEMPTTGGKLTLKDRINLALEGTFGVPAEMMLRGLGAGDQPFKEAARARVITEQLRLKNVPRSQWAFARQFPELFFDRATMEQIKGDTLSAVFQRNSRTIGHMMNWIRGKGDVFDLALATVAPYKLTPWNLVGEILSYNPVVAFSKAVLEAKRGNTRSAKLNAGKFVVGSMLTSAGWWLYQNGLLSPSLDERTEAQKARVLADQVLPPNHINISGLQRKLAGGDPTYKPGDRTVDIFRAGGLAGSIFYMTANIGRDFEKQPETQSAEHLGAIIRQSTLEQARFGLNQSFLSGVEGILTAVKDGNTDNYVRQYMNTVLSIPLPNSLATLSRATREFQPEFRAEGFGKQVENTIRNKLGFAGLDDYLPLKRGLWGEPLPQTPKGANELFYQFFDITKSRQVTDDPVPIELYRLWRKTADTRAIPSLPEKTLTMGGITYALNPEQRSRYAELVGKYRRQMADAIVINPAFHKLNDDQKLDMLDRLYREGLQTGKTFFWAEAKDKLQPKAERAGFK